MNLPFFHQVSVAGGHEPSLRHSRYERACDTDSGSSGGKWILTVRGNTAMRERQQQVTHELVTNEMRLH